MVPAASASSAAPASAVRGRQALFDSDLMPESAVDLFAFLMFVPIAPAPLWSLINLVLTLSELQGFFDWRAAASLFVLLLTVVALLLALANFDPNRWVMRMARACRRFFVSRNRPSA